MRGKGWDIPKRKNRKTGELEEGNIIYVLGTVDGVFHRRTTKKKATKTNIAWIKKNHRDVLLKLIDEEKPKIKTDFESFGLMVLKTTQAGKRCEKTQREKVGVFKNHVLPYFKNYKLEDIKTADIELWQMKLLEKLSTSMVKKAKHNLGLILKKASANDIVAKNYAELAENIEVTHKKRLPYTEEEFVKIMEHSEGWFKLYLFIVCSTGMRIGEAIGLKPEDIDLVGCRINLKRSISRGWVTQEDGNVRLKQYIADGFKMVVNNSTNNTKNHTRSIPISNELRDAFIQHFKANPEKEWVFTNYYGNPFSDSRSVNNNYWKPLLKSLNIKDRDLYVTRHTYASIMKNNGARDEWLKEVMGYSQESRVLDKHYYTFQEKPSDAIPVNNFFSYLKGEEKSC